MQKTHAQQQTSPRDTPTHPLFVFDLKTVCLCPWPTFFIFFLNTFSSAVVWAADFHLSLSKIYKVEQHWSPENALPIWARRSALGHVDSTCPGMRQLQGLCAQYTGGSASPPYHQGFSYPGGNVHLNLSWGWSKWPQLFYSLGELFLYCNKK